MPAHQGNFIYLVLLKIKRVGNQSIIGRFTAAMVATSSQNRKLPVHDPWLSQQSYNPHPLIIIPLLIISPLAAPVTISDALLARLETDAFEMNECEIESSNGPYLVHYALHSLLVLTIVTTGRFCHNNAYSFTRARLVFCIIRI